MAVCADCPSRGSPGRGAALPGGRLMALVVIPTRFSHFPISTSYDLLCFPFAVDCSLLLDMKKVWKSMSIIISETTDNHDVLTKTKAFEKGLRQPATNLDLKMFHVLLRQILSLSSICNSSINIKMWLNPNGKGPIVHLHIQICIFKCHSNIYTCGFRAVHEVWVKAKTKNLQLLVQVAICKYITYQFSL